MQIEMYNIKTFCEAYGLKPSYFYVLKKKGLAPKITKIGSKTMITVENAKEWLLNIEQLNNEENEENEENKKEEING